MSSSFTTRLREAHAAVAPSLPGNLIGGERRMAALERAAQLGLPGLRDDNWRYANLRVVDKASFTPALAAATDASLAAARALLPEPLPGLTRFVFVNGRYAESLSADPATLAGGELRTASHGAALSTDAPAVSQDTEQRFAWLNEAFATDGAHIHVTKGLAVEVLFIAVPTATAGASYPRLEVSLAAGANLTLVERHLGSGGPAALLDAAVHIELGVGAHCDHYRLQALEQDAFFVDSLVAQLAADSRYQLALLHQGAASARSSVSVRLIGTASRVELNGMSLASDKRVLDTSIQVQHLGRATVSEQLLRAIANDRSRIGFNSRVEVTASAGGADSRQSLKGLIGAEGAEVNLRPQLEIFTDEVRASHGATTGALDENTLFYLLSRGLDPQTARMLLEWAFIEDVVSQIRIPALRRQVELSTVQRLGNPAALEALL